MNDVVSGIIIGVVWTIAICQAIGLISSLRKLKRERLAKEKDEKLQADLRFSAIQIRLDSAHSRINENTADLKKLKDANPEIFPKSPWSITIPTDDKYTVSWKTTYTDNHVAMPTKKPKSKKARK